jgi:hypothetical protein
MNDDTRDTPPIPAKPSSDDRLEIVKILALMVVSFGVGFVLVILFLKPSAPGGEDMPSGTPPAAAGEEPAGYAPTDQGDEAPTEAAAVEQVGGAGADDIIDEGDAPPAVPPGRTPEGVVLEGEPFYLKCWDADGSELPGASCDRLSVLEKRFSTRLYVVHSCLEQHADEGETGKLSLGFEVDFSKRLLSFWNGASSDIEGAAAIATCLRGDLAGLPIDGFDHKYERYRIFFSVRFGGAPVAVGSAPDKAAKKATATGSKGGRLVEVVMDHVRVRKSPMDGEIFGKISSGNQVRLIKKRAKWCNVVTPNENEGWMICEALDL